MGKVFRMPHDATRLHELVNNATLTKCTPCHDFVDFWYWVVLMRCGCVYGFELKNI